MFSFSGLSFPCLGHASNRAFGASKDTPTVYHFPDQTQVYSIFRMHNYETQYMLLWILLLTKHAAANNSLTFIPVDHWGKLWCSQDVRYGIS